MIRPGVDAPLAVSVFDTPEDLGRDLAAAILAALALARRSFVLGCPSGRSLTSTYAALAAQAARERADLSQLVIAMMDEYVREEEGRFVPCPAGAHYSARRFAREEILSRLNRGLPRAKRVTEEHVWLPDPARPADFEARLGDAGGVDLFLLASGASDGHVAFNGPGSSRDSRCRVVDLSETTRRDNVASFPAFARYRRCAAPWSHGRTGDDRGALEVGGARHSRRAQEGRGAPSYGAVRVYTRVAGQHSLRLPKIAPPLGSGRRGRNRGAQIMSAPEGASFAVGIDVGGDQDRRRPGRCFRRRDRLRTDPRHGCRPRTRGGA